MTSQSACCRAFPGDLTIAKIFPELLPAVDDLGFVVAFVRSYGKEFALDDEATRAIVTAISEDSTLADSVSNALRAVMQGVTLAAADSTSLGYVKELLAALSLSDQVAVLVLLSTLPGKTVQVEDSVASQLMLEIYAALPVASALAKALARGTSEDLALGDEMPKALAVARILSELLGLENRLQLRGVWDDPYVKIVVNILGAAVKADFC